jgi:large subunit ribosomal protein L25
MDQAIKVNVPLHFINEEQCTGVKLGGGMIQKQATDVEIQCLPKDLPEYLEVDMLDVELGQIVHLSDIALPEGAIATALELGDDHDLAIASVIAPRGIKGDDEDEASDDADSDTESSDEDAAAGEGSED